MLHFYLWASAADKALPVLYYHSDPLNNLCDFGLESHLITILIPRLGAYKHLDVFSCKYPRDLPRLYLNIYWKLGLHISLSVFRRRRNSGTFPPSLGFLCWKLLSRSRVLLLDLATCKMCCPPLLLGQLAEWVWLSKGASEPCGSPSALLGVFLQTWAPESPRTFSCCTLNPPSCSHSRPSSGFWTEWIVHLLPRWLLFMLLLLFFSWLLGLLFVCLL